MHDLELLDRYRLRGDKAALDRLVERYYGFVLRVCRRQLRNDADADDAAQQVFGHLLSQAPQVHSNVAAWLHRCAHNVSVSLVRSRIARRRSEQAYLETGAGARADETDGDLLIALDECLATMPDRDRELIIQTQLLRVPQRVMAAQRGVSQQAVAKQLARSLDRLRLAISARGFAITAAALAATLEGEASATLISLSAAAAATPHLATTAATALATTTKLKLLGSAVAGLVLLSLPGTADHAPDATSRAAHAAVGGAIVPPPAWLAVAPPAESQRLVAGARDGWLDEPRAETARERRRGVKAARSSRVNSLTTIAPVRPTTRRAQETGIAQPDPFAPRVAPPDRNWQRWELSRWRPGGETTIPMPPVGTPPQSPSPIVPPSVVHRSPGNADPAKAAPTRTVRSNAVHPNAVHPNAAPVTKQNPAAIDSGGGSPGGRAPAAPAASSASAGNPSTGKNASVEKPPTSTTVSSNAVASNGSPTKTSSVRSPVAGTDHKSAPPPYGVVLNSERPTSEHGAAPHAGPPPVAPRDFAAIRPGNNTPPLQQLAFEGDFVLTLDNPRSIPIVDAPRMVQLSVPMHVSGTSLRTASALADPYWANPYWADGLLDPLAAHNVVALLSDHVSVGGDASSRALSVARRSDGGFDSPRGFGSSGLAPPIILTKRAGDDPYLYGHADGDAYRAAGIHEDFAVAVRMPWMDGDESTINSSAFNGSAMYAVQISTVPEPATWQLAVLAASAILLMLLGRRYGVSFQHDPLGGTL